MLHDRIYKQKNKQTDRNYNFLKKNKKQQKNATISSTYRSDKGLKGTIVNRACPGLLMDLDF